jgi:T5SS/PEP-CTERM-associated repeat protein
MYQIMKSRVSQPAPSDVVPLFSRRRIAAKWWGVVMLAAAVLTAGARLASASVLTNGSVSPSDNPFTPDIDEGISVDGNFIDTTVAADKQVTFEGRVDTLGTPDPADDTNTNFDIIVGVNSYGVLLISGESALRDQTLIIGGPVPAGGTVPPSADQTHRGVGVVRITGFGSVYNNDPTLYLPASMPPGFPANFSSINPRNPMVGYDLLVGESGTGTMEISAGGRAEIQDAVVVGDLAGASGTVTVDGIDSFLGNGGFTSGATVGELHQMVIGHLGTGVMSITNGGQVYAIGPNPAQPAQFLIGAVVGSDPTQIGNFVPFAGGQGTVTVDGAGSKWIIGGSLQLGGFNDDKISNTPPTQDLAGSTVQYPGNAGHGTLTVSNGGLVNVIPPTILTGTTNLDLDVMVGLYGQINLNGGTIHIDNGSFTQGSGSTAIPAIKTYRLLNDGMVSGSGTLSVGQFLNRSLGQVHVAASQTLVVNSTGSFANPAQDQELMSNYGLIDVLGTEQNRAEIDFNYTPSNVTGNTNITRPFINFQQATPPSNGGRQVGAIVAQSATLRFQSGLQNQSFLVFNSGTNVISGTIVNCSSAAGNPDGCSPSQSAGSVVGQGVIQIKGPPVVILPQGVSAAGPATNVTFENALTGGGTFTTTGLVNVTFKDSPTISGLYQLGAGGAVTVVGDLTLADGANLQLALGSSFDVTGNLLINPGFIRISPVIPSGTVLMAGETFSLLTYGGQILPTSVTFSTISFDLGNGLTLIPVQPSDTPHSIVVRIVSSAAMPVNDADLDGNGIVNANDLAIWRSRFGMMGLGDVNGNGIVDAADYTIIRDHFGLPMGAGAGGGSAVPEPSGLVLLSAGALLALAVRRPRAARLRCDR